MEILERAITEKKKILVLGFGKEGRAMTYFLLADVRIPRFAVADMNEEIINDELFKDNPKIELITGDNYLKAVNEFDLIIKSPGISSMKLGPLKKGAIVISQMGLFLDSYSQQIIGITGTKGKSTTSSLIAFLISGMQKPVTLAGNIGVPVYEIVSKELNNNTIVLEISSHQLENSPASPHIAVLLNLFQEHLDHYPSFLDYQMAKWNIAKNQKPSDFFIYHYKDSLIQSLLNDNPIESGLLPFSNTDHGQDGSFVKQGKIVHRIAGVENDICSIETVNKVLPGRHNLLNVQAALLAIQAYGINAQEAVKNITEFTPLEHRMEYVGCIQGKHFYNDSIATIPEATLQALEALGDVSTLIIGGYDRGIDYTLLTDYLLSSFKGIVLYTGDAGKRIISQFPINADIHSRLYYFDDFSAMIAMAIKSTPVGGICLLSPAAASYDQFKNFEERGRIYKDLVISLSK